jgi:hypothetical protein
VIILDTNVLSALMQTTPDPAVVRWLDEQPVESVWITSVTLFEVRFGLALLPRGKRRRSLEEAFERLLVEDLEQRIAELDSAAAVRAAELAAERQRRGRSVELRDTQIAGIALARRAKLATRNARHFADLEVTVADPWGRRSRD